MEASRGSATGSATEVAEALVHEHDRLVSILDTVSDAILTIDQRGIIESVNPATERLFGYRAAELLGRNVRVLMPSPHREHHDRYLARYRRTGTAHILGRNREVRGRRADGSTFAADLSVNRIDDLGLFVGVLRDLSDRRRLEREVVEASTLAQERLGREIHDDLGQRLSALTLLAANLERTLPERGAPRRAARALRREAEAALGEARRLARGLSPVLIASRDLGMALRALAREVHAYSGIACRTRIASAVLAAGDEASMHLYRIAQEALNNAVRHSGARRITLTWAATRAGAALTVRDDGRGLADGETRGGGLGIHLMRYRCELIGGHFEIGEAPGGGTLVRCTLAGEQLS